MLFYIEDNHFGLSVPSTVQTPVETSRRIWRIRGLRFFGADSGDPAATARRGGVGEFVRSGRVRDVARDHARLSGHSGQDTQTYKGETWWPKSARTIR